MKKDNEKIDFMSLANALAKCKEVSEQEAKKTKRFKLRFELYSYFGASHIKEMEEAFQWIYNAPLIDWERMLQCITYPDNKEFPKPLEDAKKLFGLLY